MYGYEARDRSGPMDIDEHDPMARIAQFALPNPDEGPSRKRLHSDISTPSRPFNPTPDSRPLHFGQNTPFMFHLPANIPPPSTPAQGWKPYDPSDFQPQNLGFGAQPSSSSFASNFMEDIEMISDSPARPSQVKEVEPATNPTPPAMEPTPASIEVDSRPIAGGAVSRELKNRSKKKPPKDVAKGRKYEHQHHYNFHTPAPALRHSEIPSLLLGYIQVFVNVSIVLFVLYLAVQFVLTVKRDVKDRMQEVSVEILQEIADCTKLYLTNRCDPHMRVPAMEAPCKAWEACMARDPTMVGRTNVMAETFAGVINSFVDPISWKTMAFTLTTLSFLIILTNSALWNLRSKVSEPVYQPYPIQPGLDEQRMNQIGWDKGKKWGIF